VSLEKFAHFTILEHLGMGGMATVYKARDEETEQIVALKLLHDQYGKDKEVIRRFTREADIFYKLQHPHIVPIVAHGEFEGKFYIAMNYMKGGTIHEYFSNPTEVDNEFTFKILTQIADALDFAHQNEIVHRDLKLENILLDEANNAYLNDFGIAFIADVTRLTSSQSVTGTPLYMSPEQALGIKVSNRTDIYSLAVMSYLMLTGYYPFTGSDPYTVLNKHISQPPPTPTSVNEYLPLQIDDVLLKGLAKAPEERYESASEFVTQITNAMYSNDLKTQTLVRMDAPNPHSIQTISEYKSTVLGIQPDNSRITNDSLQTNNREKRLALMFLGVIIVLLGVVATILFRGNEDENTIFVLQTQVNLKLSTDATSTAEATTNIIPTGIIRVATTYIDNPENRAELGTLEVGDVVELIGRTGPGDFVEIITTSGDTGFITSDSFDTNISIMSLPDTFDPPTRDNNLGVTNLDRCQPFANTIDNVSVYSSPNNESVVVATLSGDELIKIVYKIPNTDFFEVELTDETLSRGFVQQSQLDLEREEDENCIREPEFNP